MNNTHNQIILFLLILGMIGSCASERSITGGPVDKTAPEIVSSNPRSGSLSVDPKTDILIRFSEQMDKNSVKSALQVWPRPDGGYEIENGWTWVRVSFNDPLASNETYLLTLDKTAKDLRGNALAATHIMAFSTGEEMNAGKIRGKITGNAQVMKNGDILLFKELNTDLTELSSASADYIFQPNDDGSFELNFLNDQSYLLYYHWDRNRNRTIDANDYFGRPQRATVFARTDSLIAEQGIWPQVVGREHVKLLEVSRLYEEMYQIRTDLLYADNTLKSLRLFTADSEAHILGATRVDDDDVALHLMLKDTLMDDVKVWVQGFIDTSGHALDSDTLHVANGNTVDSLHFDPLTVSWLNGELTKYPGDAGMITLKANLPFSILSDTVFQVYSQLHDSIPLPGTLEQLDAMTWGFQAGEGIEGGQSYKWKLFTSGLDVPNLANELDSIWTGQLQTISSDSLGSIRLLNMDVGVLQCELHSADLLREFQLHPGTPVIIDDLPATSYVLRAYRDKNMNGRFDSGNMDPRIGSEEFWVYSEPIMVRARWETDIGSWELR